jgi:hypothetical protein
VSNRSTLTCLTDARELFRIGDTIKVSGVDHTIVEVESWRIDLLPYTWWRRVWYRLVRIARQ